MQSVTALAHLKSCVLYLIDPSEQCGYSVEEQIKLYGTLRPLFKNKPLLVVFTKSDLSEWRICQLLKRLSFKIGSRRTIWIRLPSAPPLMKELPSANNWPAPKLWRLKCPSQTATSSKTMAATCLAYTLLCPKSEIMLIDPLVKVDLSKKVVKKTIK